MFEALKKLSQLLPVRVGAVAWYGKAAPELENDVPASPPGCRHGLERTAVSERCGKR